MSQQSNENNNQISLLSFPSELLIEIFLHSIQSAQDINTLSFVCKQFNEILNDEYFWYKLNLRDYGTAPDPKLTEQKKDKWHVFQAFRSLISKSRPQKNFFIKTYQQLYKPQTFSFLTAPKTIYETLSDNLLLIQQKEPDHLHIYIENNKKHFLEFSAKDYADLTALLLNKGTITAWCALVANNEIGGKILGLDFLRKKIYHANFNKIINLVQSEPRALSICLEQLYKLYQSLRSENRSNLVKFLTQKTVIFNVKLSPELSLSASYAAIELFPNKAMIAAELLAPGDKFDALIQYLITKYLDLIADIAVNTTPDLACLIDLALKKENLDQPKAFKQLVNNILWKELSELEFLRFNNFNTDQSLSYDEINAKLNNTNNQSIVTPEKMIADQQSDSESPIMQMVQLSKNPWIFANEENEEADNPKDLNFISNT